MFNECWAVGTCVRHLTRDSVFSECSLPLQFDTNREEERKAPSNKTPIPLPLHQCQLCSETQLSWAQKKVAGEGDKASTGRPWGGGTWSELRSELLSCPKVLSISKFLWPESKMRPTGEPEPHAARQELAQAFSPSIPGWVLLPELKNRPKLVGRWVAAGRVRPRITAAWPVKKKMKGESSSRDFSSYLKLF